MIAQDEIIPTNFFALPKGRGKFNEKKGAYKRKKKKNYRYEIGISVKHLKCY